MMTLNDLFYIFAIHLLLIFLYGVLKSAVTQQQSVMDESLHLLFIMSDYQAAFRQCHH
ncbi:hypothetical protein F5Y05DRAFT_416465 [Hypoxylon sp. FL0543]|nr:hypothetical protein F5Y05DRAFT_416465 [Hypoxylon sp. FL0543]